MSSMSNLARNRDEQPETALQSAVLRTVEMFAEVQERSERERATYASIVARSLWRMFGDVLVVEEAEEALRRAALGRAAQFAGRRSPAMRVSATSASSLSTMG